MYSFEGYMYTLLCVPVVSDHRLLSIFLPFSFLFDKVDECRYIAPFPTLTRNLTQAWQRGGRVMWYFLSIFFFFFVPLYTACYVCVPFLALRHTVARCSLHERTPWNRDRIIERYFRRKGQQSNKFELRLRTTHPDGLIAWIGRGKVEHLILSLHGGQVLLTYKSKNEQISLRSRVRISISILSFFFLFLFLQEMWRLSIRFRNGWTMACSIKSERREGEERRWYRWTTLLLSRCPQR